MDAASAVQELKALLEDNAPYQAVVTFEANGGASGWNGSAAPWRPKGYSRPSGSDRCRSCPAKLA